MTTFTNADKRAALKRELGMRRRVYPRFVSQGRMTQEEADREIAVLEAILRDYAEPGLFDGLQTDGSSQ